MTIEEANQELGRRIAAARKAAGLSQGELGLKLAPDKTRRSAEVFIGNLERGDTVSVVTFLGVCKALRVRQAEMLAGIEIDDSEGSIHASRVSVTQLAVLAGMRGATAGRWLR